MSCRRCATPLDRPGDYCLACDTANADAVVIEAGAERGTLTILHETAVVATTTITTVPESEDRLAPRQLRNFAGRIADTVRRKRPDQVYATGDREVITAVRRRLHHDVRRVPAEDPVAAATEGDPDDGLAVVDRPPREKLGGAHTTVIGDRRGRFVLRTIADHPHVKKIVPGPIDAGGNGARGGLSAKVTRCAPGGNVRLLLRDGSTVQEARVVTTAPDRAAGERVKTDLAEALADADLDAA